jgi:cation:H+ antiporter
VLSTIGYAAVGVTLLLCMSREHRAIDGEVQREIGRDQAWFVGIFLVAVLLGMVAFTGKTWLAPLFVLVYLLYVRRELKQTDSHEVELPSPQAGSARQDPGARQGAAANPGGARWWWRWRPSCSFTSWRAWASCSASRRCWRPCC